MGVRNLEELKANEKARACFESPSNRFFLSPNVDECLGVSGSKDTGIFKAGEHEIKFSVPFIDTLVHLSYIKIVQKQVLIIIKTKRCVRVKSNVQKE